MSHSRDRKNMKGSFLPKFKEFRANYEEKHEHLQGSAGQVPVGPGEAQPGSVAVLEQQVGGRELHVDSGSGDNAPKAAEDQETERKLEVPHGEVDKQSHKAPRSPKAVAKGKEGKEDTGGKIKGSGQKKGPRRKTSAPSDNA